MGGGSYLCCCCCFGGRPEIPTGALRKEFSDAEGVIPTAEDGLKFCCGEMELVEARGLRPKGLCGDGVLTDDFFAKGL
jgi:hypothetical protein